MDAVKTGSVEAVEKLNYLENYLNAQDDLNGGTPLHWAAYHDFVEMAEFLLESGAAIYTKDKSGQTPFLLAIENKYFQFLKEQDLKLINLLLKHNASLAETDNNQQNALHYLATKYYNIGNNISQNFICCMLDRAEKIVSAKDVNGNTPLHLAAQEYTCRTLVRGFLKIDNTLINDRNKNGETPLHRVAASSHYLLADILLKEFKGADLKIKDIHGRTPLHIAYAGPHGGVQGAIQDGNPECLLIPDNDGITPQDLANKTRRLVEKNYSNFYVNKKTNYSIPKKSANVEPLQELAEKKEPEPIQAQTITSTVNDNTLIEQLQNQIRQLQEQLQTHNQRITSLEQLLEKKSDNENTSISTTNKKPTFFL